LNRKEKETVAYGNLIFSSIKEKKPNRISARLNLQMTACDLENNVLEYIFIPDDWCRNPYNQVHGGITCSVFDYLGGAGSSILGDDLFTTIDLMVTYLRPMYGDKYKVVMRYTHVGSRTLNCTGDMIDAETGIVCATYMSSYMHLNAQNSEMLKELNEEFEKISAE